MEPLAEYIDGLPNLCGQEPHIMLECKRRRYS